MKALTIAVLAALAPIALQQELTPVQFNGDQLVRQAAQGIIVPPGSGSDPVRVRRIESASAIAPVTFR